MEENIIISDEELIKYFSKKDLEDMATLFSNGQFKELLNNYFYIKKSDETKLNQDNNAKTGEELYNQYNKSNLLKEGKDDNQLEFNYAIFEKLLDNEFCQQIILTIVLFCLFKNKEKENEIKKLFNKYNYPLTDMIFPLNFLKIKYYIKSQKIHNAIEIINQLINKYEDYDMNIQEKKLDLKNIYTIETFHQKFIYFDNLFNYLFNMNNIEAKIKKLYFELKSCYYQIKNFPQGYNTILRLYQKYPEDIIIQFELGKDSVMNSKPDVYHNIIEKMRKKSEEEKEENLKGIYINYILYLEALNKLAYNKYNEAKIKMEGILEFRKKENNDILKNNIALLNIYDENTNKENDDLMRILQDKMISDNKNENISESIKIAQRKSNIK